MVRARVVVVVAAVVAVGAACDGESGRERPIAASSPAFASLPPGVTPPSFDTATAIIETEDEPVLVRVEVADTPERREFGLMFRKSLPDDAGMAFVWFEETRGGFWMKNTLIPLSVAFFDVEGKILEMLDMEPCRNDPCEIYDPGISYMGALEANQGAFESWGVSVGDVITLPR